HHGVFVGDVGGAVLFNDNGTTPDTVTGNALTGVMLGNVTGSVTFTSANGASYSGNGTTAGDGIFVASLTGVLTVSAITAGGNDSADLDYFVIISVTSGSYSGNTSNGLRLFNGSNDLLRTATVLSATFSNNGQAGIRADGSTDPATCGNDTQILIGTASGNGN